MQRRLRRCGRAAGVPAARPAGGARRGGRAAGRLAPGGRRRRAGRPARGRRAEPRPRPRRRGRRRRRPCARLVLRQVLHAPGRAGAGGARRRAGRGARLRSRAGRVCWLRGELAWKGSASFAAPCACGTAPALPVRLIKEQQPQQPSCTVRDAPWAVTVPARVTLGAARARSEAGRRGRRRAPRPCRPAGRLRRPRAPTPGQPSSSSRPAWPWCARKEFVRSAQSPDPTCHTHSWRVPPVATACVVNGQAVRRPCRAWRRAQEP
jgi:hypothetical protein